MTTLASGCGVVSTSRPQYLAPETGTAPCPGRKLDGDPTGPRRSVLDAVDLAEPPLRLLPRSYARKRAVDIIDRPARRGRRRAFLRKRTGLSETIAA
jgi:hypothetical protein